MTWHVGTELLERYADGTLPDAAAWSVETHLTGCAVCRADLGSGTIDEAAGIDDARLADVWSAVSSSVRAAQRPAGERLLVRLGVAEHDARLLAATPSLTASWLLGVALVLAASVAAAWLTDPDGGRAAFLFLVLAPLVPIAGVSVAFGPRVDPTYELGVVAPMSSPRLLLLRAVAVLTSSLLLAIVCVLALPVSGWMTVAWILPSLALTAAVLATSARWHPLTAGPVIGVGWLAVAVTLEARTGGLVAFGTTGQSVMLALLVASLAFLVVAHERIDPGART